MFFKWAKKVNSYWMHVSKFTGDVRKLESSLNKLDTLFIEKDIGEEDILEAEVTSANQLLDLLSDESRRGCLKGIWIHKVYFANCRFQKIYCFSHKALLLRCNDWDEETDILEET